jgi:hypothetical protein
MKFLEKYGGLVRVDQEGSLVSIIWECRDDIADGYKEVILALKEHIEGGYIRDVFFSDKPLLGSLPTNGWGHLSVDLTKYPLANMSSNRSVVRHKTKYRKRYDLLLSLLEYRTHTLITCMEKARSNKNTKILDGTHLILNIKRFLYTLKDDRHRDNMIWKCANNLIDLTTYRTIFTWLNRIEDK